MRKNYLSRKQILTISLLVVLIDQSSKYLARNELIEGMSMSFIPQLIKLRLTQNTGAAFSLLSNATPMLSFLSLLVAVFLIWWIWDKAAMSTLRGVAGGLLLGGSLGNGIDRWYFSSVTDFIELVPINFPIFNFADIAINLAVLCFLAEVIRQNNG